MGLKTVIAIPLAAGAAFQIARRLMSDDARIEELPAPVRGAASGARERLLGARGRVREAVREGKAERRAAELELLAEYREKKTRHP